MATQLNSDKAAKLIREQTGRNCSRQNFEKLCDPRKNGPLRDCVLQLGPLRVDGDLVLAEYLAKVAPTQINAVQPTALPKSHQPAPAAPPPPRHTDQPPDYNESRARSEYEKANLLELDRKAKEGLLLHREDVERAQATALAISKTRLLGVPSTAKQRIPHLSLDEVEILTTLIREALEELASWEVES